MKRRTKVVWRLVLGAALGVLVIAYFSVFLVGRAEVAKLSPNDLELIRAVVEHRHQKVTDAGLYFLTPTPFDKWDQRGWQRFPDEFHESIAALPKPYYSADGAYLVNMSVRSRTTHRNATMRWVSVIEWRSPDEAVVSDGVWRCQLGGGGSKSLWKKRNGRWEWERSLGGWYS
jgi:hypothetical protein